jgi:hypothetical protein
VTLAVLEQPFAVSVYTYVTLTALEVVFIKVSFIAPVPVAAALLIPVTAARLQLNVVPDTSLVGV